MHLGLMHVSSFEICSAGLNELQVAKFRAKLSDPTALKTHFSYHYSASLITDGLANGTDPAYVYTMPRCVPQPATESAKHTFIQSCYRTCAVKLHFSQW